MNKTNIKAANEMLTNERKWNSGRQMASFLDHKSYEVKVVYPEIKMGQIEKSPPLTTKIPKAIKCLQTVKEENHLK